MSAHLFRPLALKTVQLQNRVVVSPMCQYSSEDGFNTDWHLVHLGQFAIGKAGAIIQEATAVSPEGRITYGDSGLWKDDHIAKLQQITRFIHAQGSVAGIQLAHAGRKASFEKPWIENRQIAADSPKGWQTISSSSALYLKGEMAPIAMSLSEIEKVITDFKRAAERAVEAGYQIIEIHAAHGYLLHQFLSPLVNRRTDLYGGAFDNRIRLLLEIVRAVQSVLSTQSLWVRISATGWADGEGGWNLDQSVQLAHRLKEAGVEVIDVSTGFAFSDEFPKATAGFQVPFAARIKAETSMITGTVGHIKTAQQAELLLQEGQADFVLLGRRLLQNPHFVFEAAAALGVDLTWPDAYQRAKHY